MHLKAAKVKDFYHNLPRLETSRLILRKATKQDVVNIFDYSSDMEVTRYLRWGPHQERRYTEKYIDDVLVQYRQGQDGPWVIEYKHEDVVIGHIHLMDIDMHHRRAQVGFVLSRRYWNQGIMTEALEKVIKYSFRELELNRIEGLCISENRAAERVLEKSGMKREGELREYLYQKGRFWDFIVYSILRREAT